MGAALLAVLTAAGLVLVLHPSPGRAVRRAADRVVRWAPGGSGAGGAGRRPWAWSRVVVVVVLCAVVAAVPLARSALTRWAPPGWRVVQCDVGQGDALVVRSGEGAAVLVDVGPPGGAADACLRALGITRIDLLVLTHFHADHVGGLAGVLAGRTVAAALVSPLDAPAGQAGEVLAALHDAGVAVSRAGASGTGSGVAGDVRWRVLGPPTGATEPNDASVVLLLEVAGLGVLTLGDAELAAQEALAARLAADPAARSAAVLKVAHHGSAVQSARLAGLLAPAVALVSVGAGNDYGHPAPATAELYRDRGALVLGTDRCGAVAVTVRDGVLDVHARCLGG